MATSSVYLMIHLPKEESKFDHENGFFLSCESSRIGRVLARYELYKMAKDLPGVVVECGVFKGVSFVQLAAFRDFFGQTSTTRLIGFDTFSKFPDPTYEADKKSIQAFTQAAGSDSISVDQLSEVLQKKGHNRNVELIEGNCHLSIPNYLEKHPELKISLLFVDMDTYESTQTILKHLYPHVAHRGIVVFDDYGRVPGETRAVDEYFQRMENPSPPHIRKSPFCYASSYVIKGE